jgi:hypothetical protein
MQKSSLLLPGINFGVVSDSLKSPVLSLSLQLVGQIVLSLVKSGQANAAGQSADKLYAKTLS